MLLNRNIFRVLFFIVTVLNINTALADLDMPGSKDHPNIPRVAGTTIIGFAESSYDEGVFMKGSSGNELLTEKIEGKRTRILYVGPKSLSPLGTLRNYQKAFADLGEVEEVYICKGNECFRNLDEVFIWRKANRIPNNIKKNKNYLYEGDHDQVYWYGKVTTQKSLYHVSLHSTIVSERVSVGPFEERIASHPLIYLEIIEVTNFKPTLIVVTAEDMASKISEKGHIALYGIHFDLNSDQLKPESDPALEEIAKAIQADSTLNIYVVGHTDNQGTLEYNEDLSKRRANSVVSKLSTKYGIASERMISIGVGPAAPLSTNKSEEGRALNRRVELVER